MSSPRQLGRSVAKAQDVLSTRKKTLRSVEARLAETVEERFLGEYGFRMSVLRMGMLFVLAAIVAGVWIWRQSETPLVLRINGALVPEGTTDWIQTKPGQFDALHFSDGSQIHLRENSRSRCLGIHKNGAQIRLSQGRLQASIVSSPDADWRFEAGPYTVVVTGTRFKLRWDAALEELTVEMLEGGVRVEGPNASNGKTVVAGERMRVFADGRKVETTSRSVNGQSLDSDNKTATGRQPSDSAADVGTSSEAASEEVKSTSVARHRKKRTTTAAGRCGYADSAAALRVADDERRNGKLNSAYDAYRNIRRCYPNSRDASVATFRLGKIAFDHKKDWSAAAKWFRRYLTVSKDVGLMREAHGRLLEALVNSHKRSEAMKAAKTYIQNYPKGPHAALAQKVQEGSHSSQ